MDDKQRKSRSPESREAAQSSAALQSTGALRLQGLISGDDQSRGGRVSPFKVASVPESDVAGTLGRGSLPPLPGLTRKPDAKPSNGASVSKTDGFRSALVAIMQQAEQRPRSGELPPLERGEEEKDSAGYNFYIHNGIDTEHIAPMEEAWLDHMLQLLAPALKRGTQATVDQLCDETREDYMMSVKKAIVDFVLGGSKGPSASQLPAELSAVPLPWAAACAAARTHLQRNLHICSPALLGALRAWDVRAPLRLVRTADLAARTAPVELSVFCKLVASHCDDVHTVLLKVRHPQYLLWCLVCSCCDRLRDRLRDLVSDRDRDRDCVCDFSELAARDRRGGGPAPQEA